MFKWIVSKDTTGSQATDPDLEEVAASLIYKKISAGHEPNAGWMKIESAWALAVSCAVAAGLRMSMELHLAACTVVALAPCIPDIICCVGVAIAGVLFYRDPPLEDSLRAERRLRSYPCAYPNGWFHLLNSNELEPGQVVEVNALGRDYAVFRGRKTGAVGVLDAHCPHLGANLAVGGTVPAGSDCLQCPFHKWTFNGDGACVKIPHLPGSTLQGGRKGVPAAAGAKAWHVCEYYGMVLVWYHADNVPPTYHPPVVDALVEHYKPRGEFRARVNMHIQEFAENSADFLHFDPLHGKMLLPFSPFTLPLIDIVHVPDWKAGKNKATPAGAIVATKDKKAPSDLPLESSTPLAESEVKEEDLSPPPAVEKKGVVGRKQDDETASAAAAAADNQGHLSWFSDSASLTFCGKPLPQSAAHAEITFIGPGSLVMFTFDTPAGGIVMFQTHLPEAPLRQRVRFTWFADPKMPKLLVCYIVGQWLSQWRNDLFVWENKKFSRPPVLVKGDGPIQAQRRWFKQFYSASSFQKNGPDAASLEW